jgi:S-layer family protein
MKNKIIPFILGLLLIIMSTGQAFASFPDTANHKYSTAIDWVQADGIVSGYPDGTYGPDLVINRAEFTKIVVEATVGGTKTGSNCFPDVKNEWFAKYICTAKDHGIVGGNDDGTFRPGNEVNYAEALKIVLEAYFTTFPTASYDSWYGKYTAYALDGGLSFASSKLPHSFVTRAEMAEIIYWINNPQPDVTPVPTPTPTPTPSPGTTGSYCTTHSDCKSPTSFYTYCVGTWVAIPMCQNNICIDGHQWDCATQGQGTTTYCKDTLAGGQCY